MIFSTNDNDIIVVALKLYRNELKRRIEIDRDQIFDYAETKVLIDRINDLVEIFKEDTVEHE